MKTTTTLASILLAGTTAFAQSVPAQKAPVFEKGFNAAELGARYVPQERTEFAGRLYLNADVHMGPAVLGAHTLNEYGFDSKSYFGDHKVTLGTSLPVRALVNWKVDQNGMISQQFGVRLTSLPKSMATYGYLDAMANADQTQFHFLHGMDWKDKIGVPLTTEFVQVSTFPFSGKPTHYTELQLLYNLDKKGKVQPFIIGGMTDFNMSKTVGYAGVRFNF